MKKPTLAVSRFRLQNFKAVRDSGSLRFTPLTVFIGNNGVGKSSVIEGLETLRDIACDGLDSALQRWRGFEFIWNQVSQHTLITTLGRKRYSNSMRFEIEGSVRSNNEVDGVRQFDAESEITSGPGNNEIFFLRERLRFLRGKDILRTVTRPPVGPIEDVYTGNPPQNLRMTPNESVVYAEPSFPLWHFLRLNPETMGEPKQMRRVAGYLPLATDGSNIAEYLLEIRETDVLAFDGIVESLRAVLPYVQDVQPVITQETGRSVYLRLSEGGIKLPGWMFSTGTLRILAMLAVLRNPFPPPLIVIEEIENGLDPRTIHLIVEEIREAVRSGRTQVILTTHSPYLLDLVPLESLIFVERVGGQPVFTRPANDASVQRWSADFAPGRLYTMGKFRQ